MSNRLIKIKSNLNSKRVYEWLKLISVTSSVQMIVQTVGFLSGILIIRILPTTEYALYTLGNTLLGTIVVLTNDGIATGVMAEGGKVWQDRVKFGEVIVTGLDLRKNFAIVTLILGTPILIYLLMRNGSSLVIAILIFISIIPAFFSSISAKILEAVPRLQQDIVPLQKNQLAINLGRLILLCLTIFVFPFAYIVILASGIPQILGNLNLRRIASKHIDLEQKPSPVVRKNIMKTVKRILPQAIYYSVSGQITILLLSIFGSTTSIAQIGALSRIAMVLSLFTMVFGTIIVPRFARLKEDFKMLLTRYIQIQIIVFIFFCIIIGIVSVFPSQILLVLGAKYANLETEIILVVVGNSLSVFCGIIYQLYANRGWILNPILTIVLNISALVFAIIITDVSSLRGVLFLNIIVGGILLFINSFYGFFKIFKLKNNLGA